MRLRSIGVSMGLVLALVPGTGAQAAHGLTLQHSPPTGAVSGDGLDLSATVSGGCSGTECGNIEVSVWYLDAVGEALSLQASSSVPVTQATLTVTIPGNDVRYPALSYWIEAKQTACDPAGACHAPSARWPATGWSLLTVENVIRFSLVSASGAPSPGVSFQAYLPQGGAGWQLSSGAAGEVSFRVPRTTEDPRIAEAAATLGTVTIYFLGIRGSWPAPAPGTKVTVLGSAALAGFTVNLGVATIPAAPFEQGRRISLADDQITFESPPLPNPTGVNDSPASACTPEFDVTVCRKLVAKHGQGTNSILVPGSGLNVGAGLHFKTKYTYRSSVQTVSGFGYKLSNAWKPADGEIAYEEQYIASSGGEIGPRGPSLNSKVRLPSIYYEYDVVSCGYAPASGAVGVCVSHNEVVPGIYKGGLAETPLVLNGDNAGPNLRWHDRMWSFSVEQRCSTPADSPLFAANGKGVRMSFSLGVYGLTFYSVSAYSEQIHQYDWFPDADGLGNSWIFVPVPDATNPEDDVPCPSVAPDQTYTQYD